MSEAAQNIASKDINKDIDNDDHDDIEPAAGSSSASACIQFQLLGDDDDEYKFKPVYTHQSFENEFIPSYAPLEEDEVEAHEITSELLDVAYYITLYYIILYYSIIDTNTNEEIM